jgi:hypothetical protein
MAEVATKPDAAAPITTNLTPPLSPVQKALGEARANLAAATAAKDAKPDDAAAPAKPDAVNDAPPDEKKPDVTPEGEADKDAPPAEGETPKEGDEAKAEETEHVVEIPGRRAGDEPVKVTFEDEETAERVRQAVRGGLRRDELNKATEALGRQRDELDLIEQHLDLDPIGFLVERVKPELQVELARHLLTVPEVLDAVTKDFEDMQDPDKLARVQAERSRDRTKRSGEVEREMRSIANAKEQGRQIRMTVEAITPADMPEDEAGMFRDDCLTDIRNWAIANPAVSRLRPEEVITILDRRLRHYGLSPESALAGLSSGQPLRRGTAARKTPAAPAIPDEKTARTTGATLKQASQTRRDAAAVPGAGAGARPATVEPPAQQGVRERIQAVKKLLTGG